MTLEAEAQARQSLDLWTAQNLEKIRALMRQEQKIIALSHGDDIPEYLFPSKRLLSEMPLCRWGSNIEPPSGYRYIREGGVRLVVDGRIEVEPHGFFYKDTHNLVVCFNTPLFLACDADGLNPGDRARLMQQRLPLHVKEYNGGIFRLSAPRPLIASELGLQYIIG